ncbi:Prefoldin subunit-domain-containing protein [Dendryphion nanum]|uniref:Prefoldin subunit-domain-containing protein n=1 Tax=Dendryphion nanum TaxID=256645 RepID=A0A9P9DI34_9PLEO|nr:Prefoldin subunit-domain-containing protein [Dendryphion nanum]
MTTTTKDPMENIENRRAELEENITKLRDALGHWQNWELEYSILQQEIESAHSPSAPQILEIGRGLGSKLVNEKELQDLLGKDTTRNANQVVAMISRRIDYVQQNISTVQKQLDAAEKKLAATSILLESDMENEEGLPMMDIVEELDEDGNVISSELMQPGKAAPAIVEALRKTGLKTTERSDQPQATQRNKLVNQSPLEAHGYNDALSDFTFVKGTNVVEVDQNDNMIATYPIIPQGDTQEEAALRREMLQYGLSEVGSVVAEIDLETPTIEYSDEDGDDFENYDSEEDEEEDEDEYGRSIRREVSDDYRQQMLELEKKLNAKMMENVGPRPDNFPLAEYSNDIRTLIVQKGDNVTEPGVVNGVSSETTTKKKGVRFADNVDVSQAPTASSLQEEPTFNSKKTPKPTMSDTIVERTGPSPQPPSSPPEPPKVSRFKSSRAATAQPNVQILPSPPVPQPQPIPQGPKGRTLADTVTEHGSQSSNPQPPDEFDPVMINREIQVEYHKMRNKMIQQQGGFSPSAEEVESPILEEDIGKTKKVSRFKAAKLKAGEI